MIEALLDNAPICSPMPSNSKTAASPKSETAARLSERLKAAMAQANVRPVDLAHELKVTPQAVNGWIKTGRIDKSHLAGIANMVGVDLMALIGEGENKQAVFVELKRTPGQPKHVTEVIDEVVRAYEAGAPKSFFEALSTLLPMLHAPNTGKIDTGKEKNHARVPALTKEERDLQKQAEDAAAEPHGSEKRGHGSGGSK